MPKAPYFFSFLFFSFLFFFFGGGGVKVHVISLNLIAFIISKETEASLLVLAKSIY